MTDEAVLSVRGEARQLVEPDFALLHCNLHAVAQSKPAVLDLLGAQQDATTAALAALGGVARSVATDRAPLTWSTRSVTSYPERSPEGKLATGRFVGEAGLVVGMRDAGRTTASSSLSPPPQS
ncbi:hypothetical protein [Jatrophihabitans sp.]|uniref:hypothetical protein n=1 Tax=Jatrophihabitans sp. TaxID=1932789 RepID=UPI0030C72821|nr:hypothetical protein [Jatrophihabitans sp.]